MELSGSHGRAGILSRFRNRTELFDYRIWLTVAVFRRPPGTRRPLFRCCCRYGYNRWFWEKIYQKSSPYTENQKIPVI